MTRERCKSFRNDVVNDAHFLWRGVHQHTLSIHEPRVVHAGMRASDCFLGDFIEPGRCAIPKCGAHFFPALSDSRPPQSDV